jgi:hypothetical protein
VLDDGIVNKNPLSIQTDSTAAWSRPTTCCQGNYQRDGEWVWSRRITVQPFVGLNNRNVRYVTVRIFKRDQNGVDHPMADLSAVINSAGSAFPTTQVFDVYLLAIENIPGWWVFMDSIKPFVESMITDLETATRACEFRTHWITKASFGRNQGYRPYTNDDNDSNAGARTSTTTRARCRPATRRRTTTCRTTCAAASTSTAPRQRLRRDLNPHPYALADYFNHAMRYPDELALWQQRVAGRRGARGRDRGGDRRRLAAAAGIGRHVQGADAAPVPRGPVQRSGQVQERAGHQPARRAAADAGAAQLQRRGARSGRTTRHLRPCVTHPEELRTMRDAAASVTRCSCACTPTATTPPPTAARDHDGADGRRGPGREPHRRDARRGSQCVLHAAERAGWRGVGVERHDYYDVGRRP